MKTPAEPEINDHSKTEIVLTPKLSARWMLGPQHALVVGLFCAAFLVLSYLPLQSPALWSDVVYGDWMLANRTLPSTDPFMPLAQGMHVDQSSWLRQLIIGAVADLDEEWLTALFPIIVVLTAGLLACAYALEWGSVGCALVTTLFVLVMAWTRFTTFLPQHLAGLCFAGLLWLIANDQAHSASADTSAVATSRWRQLIAVAGLFVVWANLDSSFLWGLVVLACLLVGELARAAAQTRSLRGILEDRVWRHHLYSFEIALLATLVNPAGIDLWLNLLWFGPRENLASLTEWQPLLPLSREGWGYAASIVAMVVVFRRSRAPIGVSRALLLLVFAAAALVQRRWIFWYAPIFGFVMVPHFVDLLNLRQAKPAIAEKAEAQDEVADASWAYSLICLLLIWVAFSLSGLSRPLLGGKPRSLPQLHGRNAPLGLAEYMRGQPTSGQAIHPQWWGDWLVRQVPEFQPFVTSRVEAVPRQVWRDYQRVMSVQAGWQRALDRYRVKLLIADKNMQRLLISSVRGDPDWQPLYEDDAAILFGKSLRSPRRQESADDNTSEGFSTDQSTSP